MQEMSVQELKSALKNGVGIHLLDVREADEVQICALPDAEHIPMLQLFSGMEKPTAELDSPIVVYCHHGPRSIEAASFLHAQGYTNVRSLHGGIDAWAQVIEPKMRRY
jgi:rhodanese-related sulfurtransferase